VIEQHAATVRFKRQDVFSSITPRHGVGAGIELSQCLALAERGSGLHASSFHYSVTGVAIAGILGSQR
jgi:hypothetical protein